MQRLDYKESFDWIDSDRQRIEIIEIVNQKSWTFVEPQQNTPSQCVNKHFLTDRKYNSGKYFGYSLLITKLCFHSLRSGYSVLNVLEAAKHNVLSPNNKHIDNML